MSITEETRRESNQKVDRQTRYNEILSVLIPGVEIPDDPPLTYRRGTVCCRET